MSSENMKPSCFSTKMSRGRCVHLVDYEIHSQVDFPADVATCPKFRGLGTEWRRGGESSSRAAFPKTDGYDFGTDKASTLYS